MFTAKDKQSRWWVDINKVRTDYIRIDNIKQFTIGLPPKLHPDHPDYKMYWARATKKCIEGMWGKEFGKYRFMTGKLFFVKNYTILEHTIKGEGTKSVKPIIFDYFWDFAYMALISRGFSGFIKDQVYTSNNDILLYEKGFLELDELDPSCFNDNGDLKEYVKPWDYLYKLHDKPLGRALILNETIDNMTLGSRGGGKSFFPALGEIEHRFLFSNAHSYEQYRTGNLKSNSLSGGAESIKSSEMLSKFTASQDAKSDTSNPDFVEWFGIWGNEEDDDFRPSPFYKRTKGNLDCPNKKEKDIFRDSYKIRTNGEWREKNGTNRITHVNFNHTKPKAAQAASGGRHEYCNFEEVGESPIIIDICGSTENCFKRGIRFGYMGSQGTSGNINFIQQTKIRFLDPRSHKIQAFKNQNGKDGENGECAYFLPNYMVQFDCKDADGNTNFKRAIDKVNRERKAAAESKAAALLYNKMLNEPCYTHEMWASSKGYYLPYEEALDTEMYLMEGNRYKTNGKCVELFNKADSLTGGISYKILHDAEPHTEFPIPKKMADPSGCVVIYDFPKTGKGVPNDLYCFIGHDPYVEEDITRGGSLGVSYVLMNPKYISQGFKGNIIVATYIGKPDRGLDHYNTQLEYLISFYGGADNSLWYENNRGQGVRGHFLKRNKFNYLAITPNREQQSNSLYEKQLPSTGVFVGARGSASKLNLLKKLKDWLLQSTTFTQDGVLVTKLNIQRIPCLFTVRQIAQFNLVDNFDGISALLLTILGLNEYMNKLESDTLTKKEQEEEGDLFVHYKNSKYLKNDKRNSKFKS